MSLKALLVATSAVVALVAVPVRAQISEHDATLLRADQAYQRGDTADAIRLLTPLAEAPSADPNDIALLARIHCATGQEAACEDWLRRAARRAETWDGEHFYVPALMLARRLEGAGRAQEAVEFYVSATKIRPFKEEARLMRGQALGEDAAQGYEDFVRIAELLEANHAQAAALLYRGNAAAGLTRAGMGVIRQGGSPERALDYFARADAVLALDNQPVDARMTVLRDMVVAGYRSGRFDIATEAARQLFELCHPAGESWTCPAQGVASAPFPPTPFVGEGAPAPLTDLHLKLLSKLSEQIFASISWDPVSLTLRPEATEDEFLGAPTESAEREGSCLREGGVAYAKATGWEEDRVEFERCWGTRERAAIIARAKALLANGEPRLIVKLMLNELQFSTRFFRVGGLEPVEKASFAGVPLTQIQAAVEARPEEALQSAWVAANEVIGFLRDGERLGLRSKE